MKYCIAGKNSIAVYCLNLLLELGINKKDILVICNSTDNGQHSWQPSLKNYAKDNGINEILLPDAYEIEPMIFLSLEFDKIIRTKLFKTTRIYNIHFSLLPAYKGMFTSIFPILNGEEKSGVTLHKIDDGIDTGEIIKQKRFDLPFGTSGYQLYQLYLENSKILLKENIEDILSEKIESKAQVVHGASYYSKKTIDFANVNISFYKTCYEVCNYVNAFSFRPYQFSTYNSINIVKALTTNNKSIQKPGSVIHDEKYVLELSTIDYNVLLLKDALDEIIEASKINDISIIKKFYDLNYDLEDKNDKGWNALIVSCYNAAFDVVKFIISIGCDVNSFNNNGTSALMYAMTNASQTNDLTILQLLIESEADLYHKDLRGFDIFYYAKKYQNPLVIDYLENLQKE